MKTVYKIINSEKNDFIVSVAYKKKKDKIWVVFLTFFILASLVSAFATCKKLDMFKTFFISYIVMLLLNQYYQDRN